MFEQDKISQILDILGNKNRRRIIDLLNNKPCFVTEISDKLSINPKAVIEHLALMQKEDVIGSYCDDKRRKYYYLLQKINLSVKIDPAEATCERNTEILPLSDILSHLKELMTNRQMLMNTLESIERDIDQKMEELVINTSKESNDDSEPEILLALLHGAMTPIELSDACGRPIPEITATLHKLVATGYLENITGKYALKENILPTKSINNGSN